MNDSDFQFLAAELNLPENRIRKVAALFEDGATVPFIARYRKEVSGGMDEVVLLRLREAVEQLRKVNERRGNMLESLRERNLLTDELASRLGSAHTLTMLEDLYLPYKTKRKTRASAAREKGLEPLAKLIYGQRVFQIDLRPYIVKMSRDDALAGASDIIAEWISEDLEIRTRLRDLFARRALFASKAVKSRENEAEAQVFRDYFDYSEPVHRVPSHRALAVMRGAGKGFLTIQLRPLKDEALRILGRMVIRNPRFPFLKLLKQTSEDAYTRLILPSLENEFLNRLKGTADAEAIQVFAANLRKLLLEPPLGARRVLSFDPGFRTGCKTTVLDSDGSLLEHLVVFPEHPGSDEIVKKLAGKYRIEAVAVGNGTAGRETEAFLRKVLPPELPVVSVNESGASIYSAGEVARREFPELDLTFRSSVSIGRRLQDPLSELIKIDAKSIGVGQYQHDVDQGALKKSLDDVVVSCVNRVGVELNNASMELLARVSGLTERLARNIVDYRTERGMFSSRAELLNVKGLGPKAYSLCAGFLRIRGAENPLDASGVHPERYEIVNDMAKANGWSVTELMRRCAAGFRPSLEPYLSEEVGLPTLEDILSELAKPGRDPRAEFQVFSFAEHVHTIDDLEPGMRLNGIVTNVTKFGAFVDIGVHQDGLLHISRMADRYIADPSEVVSVHDHLEVTVIEVDRARRRISLSLLDTPKKVPERGKGI